MFLRYILLLTIIGACIYDTSAKDAVTTPAPSTITSDTSIKLKCSTSDSLVCRQLDHKCAKNATGTFCICNGEDSYSIDDEFPRCIPNTGLTGMSMSLFRSIYSAATAQFILIIINTAILVFLTFYKIKSNVTLLPTTLKRR